MKFSRECEREAEKFSSNVTNNNIEERRDFRGVFTITIDPADAKDFDDALSLKRLENRNYEIGVHIADVAHFVDEETILDEEARLRTTSIYLIHRYF